MKILYISHVNVSCGSTTALSHIIRGMKERGHQVLVATCIQDGPFLRTLDEMECKYVKTNLRSSIYPLNKNIILYLPRILWMKWCIKKARQEITDIIREYKPDIVHTNVGPLSVAFEACKKLGVPHIWHHREYTCLYPNLYFFPSKRAFLAKVHVEGNYNICITQGVFDHIQGRQDLDTVIYDGMCSQANDKEMPQSPKKDYILFVGRIEKGKGALGVIESFADFHKHFPTVRLKLAGDYRKNSGYYLLCKKRMDELGIAEYVDILGLRNDIYSLMQYARMLIVNSPVEGFGFTTAEAMLNGCVVVGRNTTGTKEQFDKGLEFTGQEIGFRFNDDKEMLSAMLTAMETDCTHLCKEARRTVLHYYTIEGNVQKVEDFYKKVLEDRKKGASVQ